MCNGAVIKMCRGSFRGGDEASEVSTSESRDEVECDGIQGAGRITPGRVLVAGITDDSTCRFCCAFALARPGGSITRGAARIPAQGLHPSRGDPFAFADRRPLVGDIEDGHPWMTNGHSMILSAKEVSRSSHVIPRDVEIGLEFHGAKGQRKPSGTTQEPLSG